MAGSRIHRRGRCVRCETATDRIDNLCDVCLAAQAKADRVDAGLPERVIDPDLLHRIDVISRPFDPAVPKRTRKAS